MSRLAFVLGNGFYKSKREFPNINYATKDAVRTFQTLTVYPTGLFSPDKLVIAKNVSFQKLRIHLREFFARVKREDFVLMYFACHAKRIGGGRLVLAMTNTKPTELVATGVVVDDLIAHLDEKEVQRYVIVLDCCRAGVALPGIRHRGVINDAKIPHPGVGKVIVASCLEYQLAHELKTLEHGLFSFYFNKGLCSGEPVSTDKEYIDIRNLCNWVASKIKDNHNEIAQEPVVSGDDETGELIIGRNPKFCCPYLAKGRIHVDATIVQRAPEGWFLPGDGRAEWFQDHEMGPEMVIVPAGSFMMGSPEEEREREVCESPQHLVTIVRPFAVSRHAVTRGQFATFVDDTGRNTEGGALVAGDYLVEGWLTHNAIAPSQAEEYLAELVSARDGRQWKEDPQASWTNPKFQFPQDNSHPVVCVSWEDAKAYATWLSRKTGREYRLLTEAEWEYAARADTITPFWWGTPINRWDANYDVYTAIYKGGGDRYEGKRQKQTVPVGKFNANPWGLYQVHGNVWEWCEDIWHANYDGAPSYGSAWLQGGDATRHVVRGGSWDCVPGYLRAARRNKFPTNTRENDLGFRVGSTLTAGAGAIPVALGAH